MIHRGGGGLPTATHRILIVFGTRPEAIKMAPIVREMAAAPGLQPIVVVTGQHRKMLDQVLATFAISPDIDLDIHADKQTLAGIASRTLDRLEPVLDDVQPAMVLVQGDTSTTFFAALSSFYKQIPVGHVEAGLRTNEFYAPFPEELNRRLTTQLTSLQLAPTPNSRDNLIHEGVEPSSITVTGNTVIDALLWALAESEGTSPISELQESDGFLLVTAHRRESWGPRMTDIATAVADVAEAHPELTVLFPIHRNPAVREAVLPQLEGLRNIKVVEPLEYPAFVWAMKHAVLILTDSGGVQEEAPSLGTPVLVMRDVSERPEALEAGTVRLVGTSRASITDGVLELIADQRQRELMTTAANPYGDGKAAPRVIAAIEYFLGLGPPPNEFG